jgi:hypothetical protein
MTIVLLLVAGVFPALAQLPTGTILGVTRDPSGGMIPAATVTVRNTETGLTRDVTTGDDGAFRVPALPVGHYTVKIDKAGFNTQTQEGLTLEVSQELVVNATLTVGSSTQEVVVTGESPIINTTNSATGSLVNEDRMADLPLNGRNYVDLTLIQPGVQQNILPTGGGGGTTGVFFSSNGASIRSNNFTLDGASLVNQFGGSTSSEAGTTLGVDGIREYKVVTHSFSAEYGQSMGSQIVMVSKGGSNQWSGGAFEYLRNSSLDARNFFDRGYLLGGPRLPEFQRNNFGGSFGGPIKKDKTFFFGVYEGLRQNLGVTITDTVPLATCRTATSNPCATFSSGNVAAVIQPFLAQYPLPNLGTTQYTFPATSRVRVDFGQIRCDQILSTTDSLFGRYTIDDSDLHNPYTNPIVSSTGAAFPQFGAHGLSRNQFLTLSENHVLSPELLNQFRLSYSRTNFRVDNDFLTTPLNPQGELIGPNYSLVAGQPLGTLGVGGLTGFGPNAYPTYHIQNIGTVSDDVFYTRGRHALKVGTLLNRYGQANIIPKLVFGSLSFTNVATFLEGFPSSFSAVGPYPGQATFVMDRYFTYNTLGFYVQDDFRANSRLTLNLGVRYEIWNKLHELNNRQSNIPDILTSSTFRIGPVWNNYSLGDWSPRVGFAYDPFGNGKTAIRGGLGIY